MAVSVVCPSMLQVQKSASPLWMNLRIRSVAASMINVLKSSDKNIEASSESPESISHF